MRVPSVASSNVAGKTRAMSWMTGWAVVVEVPKSPVRTSPR